MNDLPNIGELVAGQEEAARGAYALEESIVATIRDLRHNWVQLAGHLYAFHAEASWLALGYDSLELWLASPDIEIGRSHFFRLVENYREFVIERGVDPVLLSKVDFTKARETLPAIRRGHVDAAEALADAEALTRTDLEEKYRHRPPIQGMAREIKADDFHYETCSECGAKKKVRDV